MLLSIDPSTTTVGAALFVPFDRRLFAATSLPLEVVIDEDPLVRWLRIAELARTWAVDELFHTGGGVTNFVFERPQFYSAVKSKGDPNKLVGVLGVGAALAGMFYSNGVRLLKSYLPAEWIGQLSKVCPTCRGKAKRKCKDCHGSAWETPRGRRIASRLSPEERAKCPDQNDAIDAVGIGLKHLGRLEPVRVYSNGRD